MKKIIATILMLSMLAGTTFADCPCDSVKKVVPSPPRAAVHHIYYRPAPCPRPTFWQRGEGRLCITVVALGAGFIIGNSVHKDHTRYVEVVPRQRPKEGCK